MKKAHSFGNQIGSGARSLYLLADA